MTKSTVRKVMSALREIALSFPGATEDFPWGERVVKVNKKVFVFLGRDEGTEIGFGVKLPESGPGLLMMPFAKPSGYGLGKSGWVNVQFSGDDDIPPIEEMRAWFEESYRAVAPAKLAAQLGAAAPVTAGKAPAKKAVAKKPAPEKPAPKKPAAKKAFAKKAVTKKAATEKTVTKRTIAGKATAKKTTRAKKSAG
ncbi:MAG: MmcQ/YjbR family DNA-binding protein [Minicystis sp.]